jgi:polar amino acid transport system substrate-binding protein
MKALLLAMALGLAAAGAAQAGATLDRVKASGVLTDLVVSDYPPFGFINDANELDGFDVEVARAVAARLGVALKPVAPGWEAFVSGHWQGRWDVCICSMSPTADRAKVLDFPAIYYRSPAWLIVHRDETRIQSIADIAGKRIGVGLGSTYESYLDKSLVIAGAAPVEFPFQDAIAVPGDEAVNFRNLALGAGLRLDAVIADLATAKAYIAATGKLKLVGTALYGEPNAVATDQGDPEWDTALAAIIAELKQDGTLARLSRKYFDADITQDGS